MGDLRRREDEAVGQAECNNQYRLILYGAAMIVLFLGFRRGFVPAVQSLFDRAAGARSARTANPLLEEPAEAEEPIT